MCSDEFKIRLDFSFTVIFLAKNNFLPLHINKTLKYIANLNLKCMCYYAFLSDESLFTRLNYDIIGSLTYRCLVYR